MRGDYAPELTVRVVFARLRMEVNYSKSLGVR